MVIVPFSPENCVWELTLKCNMRCIHCGSRAGSSRTDELTVEEALRVADQLIALGCRKLTFIGGEVFLYQGWHKIARRLTDHDVIVNIITNGFILGDEQIRHIKFARLANVAISVDGMAGNHNAIRNVSTSFDRIMLALDKLTDADINIAAVTTLLDFNFDDLPAMYELFVDKGVKVWQLQVANPMGNMGDRQHLLLAPEKIPLVTKFIREKRMDKRLSLYAGDNIGYYDENESFIRGFPGTLCTWQGCQAGLRVVGIDSVGNVKGCESIYSDALIEGNLKEASLESIWFQEGAFAYNREFNVSMLAGNCSGCDKGAVCRGGCRGACFFNKGNFFENAYCHYNLPKT